MRKIVVYDEKLIPEYKTSWSMCMDLKSSEDCEIQPWEVKIIKTWIKTNFPSKIYARSSLSLKKRLVLMNSVWIIDEDYRGEIWVIIWNMSWIIQRIEKYERIAQMEIIEAVTSWDDKTFNSNIFNEKIKVLSKEEWETFGGDENLDRTWWFWSTWNL